MSGVMRLGYVNVRVTDLDAAKKHYQGTLGMDLTAEQPGRLFLKGWDEWDHHSLVIEEGGVGLIKLGYKCSHPDDIADIERRVNRFGLTCERMAKGDNLGVGDGLRFQLPSQHTIEIYAEAEFVGTGVGTLNPDPFPGSQSGVAVPRLDHALVTCDDPETAERFFTECLGFRTTERVITNPADAQILACFLSCSNTPHDIAFIKGPDGKLHHFAYLLEDWSAIGRAGDLLSMADVPIEVSPTRHGITRGRTIYFFDPSGNRNEVFAGGYQVFDDFPTITWTADQLGKAIFYVERALNDTFTTVFT